MRKHDWKLAVVSQLADYSAQFGIGYRRRIGCQGDAILLAIRGEAGEEIIRLTVRHGKIRMDATGPLEETRRRKLKKATGDTILSMLPQPLDLRAALNPERDWVDLQGLEDATTILRLLTASLLGPDYRVTGSHTLIRVWRVNKLDCTSMRVTIDDDDRTRAMIRITPRGEEPPKTVELRMFAPQETAETLIPIIREQLAD